MKKHFLIAASMTAIMAGAAFAADLPSRKGPPMLPPPPPPPPMWTGFYAGLNAGYGFGTNSSSWTAAIGQGGGVIEDFCCHSPIGNTADIAALAHSGVAPTNQYGFIGGGQVGYNYQYGSNIVLGIEADIQGAGIRGSGRHVGVAQGFTNSNEYDEGYVSTASGAARIDAGVDWMGTVRGRLGYLFTPTLLLYGTGGLSYGGVHANVASFAGIHHAYYCCGTTYGTYASPNQTFVGGGSKSQTLVGWNAGGGIEWMFMPNWSLKAEAIYWNLGNMNVPIASFASEAYGREEGYAAPGATFGTTRVNYQGVIARAGVNYHFSWGAAPVMAKY